MKVLIVAAAGQLGAAVVREFSRYPGVVALTRADLDITGVAAVQARVAAEDFRDLLSRNGIELIAERIEDEKTVVQLLEFNIAYGQGYLFGEPKPMDGAAAPLAASLAGTARRLAS